MLSYKAPLRFGVLAGASVLALALAAPVMADQLQSSPGSTVNVPTAPDVGGGYRPDPTRKTVGELEQEMAQAGGGGGGSGGGSMSGGGSGASGSGSGSGSGSMPSASGTSSGGGSGNTSVQGGGTSSPGTGAGSQPIRQGTAVPSGPGRPMGDATSPGSGNYGNRGAVSGTSGTTGTSGSVSGSGGYTGAFPNSAANLQVERVNIADLPPDLQAAVRSRMDRQQRPNELVETTILNRLALMGSEYRLDSAQKMGPNYVLRVSTPGGQQATMLYESSSGTLRQVQM